MPRFFKYLEILSESFEVVSLVYSICNIAGIMDVKDDEFVNHVTHHYDFIGDKIIIGKFWSVWTD